MGVKTQMIYVLLMSLCVLLYIAWIIYKDIFSPAFVFGTSFVFSTVWAVIYKERWELDLGLNTFVVISGGVFLFLVSSYFTHILLKSKKKMRINISPPRIYIERWKLYVFIAFEMFSIFITFIKMKNVMKGYGGSNLSEMIFLYRSLSMNGRLAERLPGYIVLCRTLVTSGGYWFTYIVASELIIAKKIPCLESVVVLLAMISSVSLGGRNGLVNILLAFVVCLYFVAVRNNKFKLNIKFKYILVGIVFVFVFMIVFQNFGSALGRTTNTSTTIMDYLAKYCGAEIKNLDIFLNNTSKDLLSHNNQTFIYMVHWIGGKLGENTDYVLDLPYNKINGFNLGNVYTTFYPFIYDYGYLGVVVLTPVMGVLSQISYEFAKRYYSKSTSVFSIVLYAYIFNSLLFSFFSNKFFEQQFTAGFFRSVIFWVLFYIFFCRMKVKMKMRIVN